MPENKFEKQVQQKMEELRFSPSDAVWQKVEKEISVTRKRRRIFLWLPLCFIIIGGAAALYYLGINARPKMPVSGTVMPVAASLSGSATAYKKPVAEENPKPDTDTSATRPAMQAANSAGPSTNGGYMGETEKDRYEHHAPTAINRHFNKPGTRQAVRNSGQPVPGYFKDSYTKTERVQPLHANNTPQTGNPMLSAALPVGDKLVSSAVNGSRAVDPAEINSIAAPEMLNKRVFKINPPLNAAAIARDSLQTPSLMADKRAVLQPAPVLKTQKKWQWGFNVNIGRSGWSEGLPGFLSGSSGYHDPAAANSSSGSVSNGGLNNGVTTPPASVKTGISFSAGGIFGLSLGRQSRLLAGLAYHYASTRMLVGPALTGGAAQYFTGSGYSYTNAFHFIELPVSFEKRLGRRSRFSVNGGASFSLLVASNALQYNPQQNIYYKDNNRINKMQWGLLAGIDYRLFPTALPIMVGPLFTYNPSQLFNHAGYGSRHLFFSGISARVFLQRRK